MQVSRIALHLHVAVERLSAMDHLLSPAINRSHFTAGTKAGCLPGPDTSLLLKEAGLRLRLILEVEKSQMIPKPGRISLCWSCFISVTVSVRMLLGRGAGVQYHFLCLADAPCV